MEKRKIAILGSTGSIGIQALDVIREHRDLFDVQLLTAGSNSSLLIRQAIEFDAACAIIADDSLYDEVYEALNPHGINVFAGMSSIIDAMSTSDNIDMVLSAMVGFRGLEPTLAALRSGKAVAIANKEPLVAAGKIVMQTAREHNAPVLPVDSEHSAIFQALQGEHSPIERIFLTASGGPFLRTPASELAQVTVAEGLLAVRSGHLADHGGDSPPVGDSQHGLVPGRCRNGPDEYTRHAAADTVRPDLSGPYAAGYSAPGLLQAGRIHFLGAGYRQVPLPWIRSGSHAQGRQHALHHERRQ